MARIHPASNGSLAAAQGPRLTREGQTIRTPKYDIEVTKDSLVIRDRKTGKTITAWGDPHLRTDNDGNSATTGADDFAKFNGKSLTLDLKDGTKITIKPTEMQNGVSFIDKVAIMNGKDATVIGNVHGEGPVDIRQIGEDSLLVDDEFADGIALYADEDLAKLFYAADNVELTGGTAAQEIDLDQMEDGKSALSFEKFFGGPRRSRPDEVAYSRPGERSGSIGGSGQVGGSSSTGRSSGSMFARLFALLRELQDQMKSKIEELDGLSPDDTAAKQEILFEIQEMQQTMQQVVSTATNISKILHDTSMSVIQNTRSS